MASGPNRDDYAWTGTVMMVAGDKLDGLSLHYYTTPPDGPKGSGTATGLDKSFGFPSRHHANSAGARL